MKHMVAVGALVAVGLAGSAMGAERKILGEYFTQPG
jgi:hypothetical protein